MIKYYGTPKGVERFNSESKELRVDSLYYDGATNTVLHRTKRSELRISSDMYTGTLDIGVREGEVVELTAYEYRLRLSKIKTIVKNSESNETIVNLGYESYKWLHSNKLIDEELDSELMTLEEFRCRTSTVKMIQLNSDYLIKSGEVNK